MSQWGLPQTLLTRLWQTLSLSNRMERDFWLLLITSGLDSSLDLYVSSPIKVRGVKRMLTIMLPGITGSRCFPACKLSSLLHCSRVSLRLCWFTLHAYVTGHCSAGSYTVHFNKWRMDLMKAAHIQQLCYPVLDNGFMLAESQISLWCLHFILHEMWRFGEGRNASINRDMDISQNAISSKNISSLIFPPIFFLCNMIHSDIALFIMAAEVVISLNNKKVYCPSCDGRPYELKYSLSVYSVHSPHVVLAWKREAFLGTI